MTTYSMPIGSLRQCTTCHAPDIDPFPDTWTLDLIKEGPPTGPVDMFHTPHTDTCTAEVTDPQPGLAVRVPGQYVTSLTVTMPPPVSRPRFASGGYIPTGATAWQPGDSDPIADLRAARDAIENEPYRPEPLHLTGRAYRAARKFMDRLHTERINRQNINGLIYYAPIVNTDPEPADSNPGSDGRASAGHTVDWIQLGHTDAGYAFNDDGRYIPARPPDPYANREDHIHWAGPESIDRQRREIENAIYGGPPADPEPQPDTSSDPATE